jgi:hypothetical protein
MAPAAPLPAPQQQQCTIDDVVDLFRSTALRRFRIDIETDSTITGDESQERQDRQGLIESLTKMVEAWGPIVEQQPVMANMAGELMMFGIRAFRVGRTLEETVQETVDKLSAELGQPKPPPQPSPDEMVKLAGIKAKTQAEIQKAGIDLQQAQHDARAKSEQTQMDGQLEAFKAQNDAQREQQKHELEVTRLQLAAQNEREKHHMEMTRKAQDHQHQMESAQQTHALGIEAKQTDIAGKKELTSVKAETAKESAKAKGESKSKGEKSEPKEIIRDPKTKKVVGVKVGDKVLKAVRDEHGQIVAIK